MGEFRIGDRVRFREAFLKYPTGFVSIVIDFDDSGDPVIQMPDGSRDNFYASDLMNLCDRVEDEQFGQSPTLLDQFAMAALTGLLMGGEPVSDTAAREAYTAAHCMMKAREVQK